MLEAGNRIHVYLRNHLSKPYAPKHITTEFSELLGGRHIHHLPLLDGDETLFLHNADVTRNLFVSELLLVERPYGAREGPFGSRLRNLGLIELHDD